ncbi:MAG: enoyl-CoA hydratase-related protein [Pseudomonadota bacterium]
MSDQNAPLLFSVEAGVARLHFNRPAVLNAIDVPMAEALHAACRRLQHWPGLRVVVLSGEGRAFMAGGDLASFHDSLADAPATAGHMITPLHAALLILTELPQPVIACLHGAIAGAGVSIALACDLAIAADDARFSIAYARIGASLDAGCSWSLPRIVGLRKAMELSLLATTIDAGEALRLGLVNCVVPPAQLADEVAMLVRRLVVGPTAAYGRIKRLLRMHQGRLAEHLEAERTAFCAGAADHDFREGVLAFFDKRAANFIGC